MWVKGRCQSKSAIRSLMLAHLAARRASVDAQLLRSRLCGQLSISTQTLLVAGGHSGEIALGRGVVLPSCLYNCTVSSSRLALLAVPPEGFSRVSRATSVTRSSV